MRRLRNFLGRVVVPVLALVSAFVVGAILNVLTDGEHLKEFGTDPIGAVGGAVGLVIRGYGASCRGRSAIRAGS
jgi:hypothetical protein